MGYQFITQRDLQEKNDLDCKECRIRIYGKTLGTTQDIICFWKSIEKNYINIIACNRLIKESNNNKMGLSVSYSSHAMVPREKINLYNRNFISLYEKYDVIDIISPDEYPMITKINFNSPGFWEVIGQWNVFEQLRKYIQERHLRNKDKIYTWNTENKEKIVEIESKMLSNDLLKLEITQKMINQLKEIGLSDIEIRHVVQNVYGNLELLNPHIDSGRIVEIKKVDIHDQF